METTNKVTLFWGTTQNPWSFGNEVIIPEEYVRVDMCGLVDDNSKAITAECGDCYLNLEKRGTISVPVAVYVNPTIAKEVEAKIFVKAYGKSFKKMTIEMYEDSNGFGLTETTDVYENGILTDSSCYDCESGDECDNVLGQYDYQGESFYSGMTFSKIIRF